MAGAVALQLWQLREGLTLADWKTAHPDENVSGADTSAVATQLGDWCAAAEHRQQIGARIVTRTAFFYPPPPDSALTPPDSVPDLVTRCRLGLVWVRADVPDTTAARFLSDSVSVQLAALYGATLARPVHFWGSALWTRTARFHKGRVSAVSALRPAGPRASSDAALPAVLAFAFLDYAGLSLDDDEPARVAYAPVDSIPLDSAAALARLGALYDPLRALANSPPPAAHDSAGALRRALVQPLQRWIAAAAGLPMPRRAAAFYLADRVLERAMCGHALCEHGDSISHAPLVALGARFNWNPLAGSWVYEHSWMTQARIFDRDSPLGQRILLYQLAHARDFSETCREGAEGFRKVIDDGERYLARVPASPVAAEVHFDVADAYRDIVALAHGAGGIYADSSRYGAEAGAAAAKALDHYAAAMRAGPAAEVARAAWQRAWWMKAGLAPRDVRFYCVYD